MRDMNQIVGSHNILFVTLDTLRFDVAEQTLVAGGMPNLASRMEESSWQRRHTPANFTYAAHHAFFAGFLPTPIQPGPHSRLFATEFIGSESTSKMTCVFSEANIIQGLAARGYESYCIGGVGFFNKQNELGNVLPSYFQHSYWSPEFGVACRESTENQVDQVIKILGNFKMDALKFVFVNVSALHQPNRWYLEGAREDSPASQSAALQYVDGEIGRLFEFLEETRPWFCIVCSDHGTCYGEQGYTGHRVNHAVVGDVPYTEFVIE